MIEIKDGFKQSSPSKTGMTDTLRKIEVGQYIVVGNTVKANSTIALSRQIKGRKFSQAKQSDGTYHIGRIA